MRHALKTDELAAHEPGCGRFRSYLLACLKHHVIDLLRKPVPEIVEPIDKEPDPLATVEARPQWPRAGSTAGMSTNSCGK